MEEKKKKDKNKSSQVPEGDPEKQWKVQKVSPDDPQPPPLETSSFATLFPAYREKYQQDVWPTVKKVLQSYGIGCEQNLVEGSMTVYTTKKMWDPYSIIKARDQIKLLSRSINIQKALKIMEDGIFCDIIKIKNLVRNKERFIKRRERLVGKNGCTLKAIEILTECDVIVQGNTVACMGTFSGIQEVRKIVLDCMRNIHPIYRIKVCFQNFLFYYTYIRSL